MKYSKSEMGTKWAQKGCKDCKSIFYPPAKHLILLRFFLCRK